MIMAILEFIDIYLDVIRWRYFYPELKKLIEFWGYVLSPYYQASLGSAIIDTFYLVFYPITCIIATGKIMKRNRSKRGNNG